MTVEELDFDKRNNTRLDLALGITFLVKMVRL